MNTAEDRIRKIRQAEAVSHAEAYSNNELFSPGSWLAKPVKTVLELLPEFADYTEFHALDIGSGVGRNSIPVAEYFKDIRCRIDCIDILDLAIQKLNENARHFGVADAINGIVIPIDAYRIKAESYDLIMAVSALEHIESKDAFINKLTEIRDGLRAGGIGCFIVNTSVREHNKATGMSIDPQFEVNLQTEELQDEIENLFSDFKILKHTVVHQKYDIPRDNCVAALETDVVTYVVKRVSNKS